MSKLIHRQFEDKDHEKRFRSEMIKAGYSPALVDRTIRAINQKRFFTEPRREYSDNIGTSPLIHFGVYKVRGK